MSAAVAFSPEHHRGAVSPLPAKERSSTPAKCEFVTDKPCIYFCLWCEYGERPPLTATEQQMRIQPPLPRSVS